ncbi:MAG: Crp/Fnr family transcriptional regulator [Bacteroidia bacterium]|nr:Crp/Fnr family transcriptional regulator [Bacteroidia bacterium]
MNISPAFLNLKNLLTGKGAPDENVIYQIMGAFKIHSRLKRNQNLITPGEVEEHLYYVLSGTLRLYCMKGEEEICYNFGYPGTFISAYTSFLSGKPSESYIKAITDCELIGIHKKDFYELVDRIPQIEKIWRIFTEEALLERMERELEMLMLSPEERFGKCMEKASHLFQFIPQKYLASYLGMKPETLSRIKRIYAEKERKHP